MAHKATSFKVDDKKKVIILYTNVEAPAGEKTLIEFYLGKGYTPMFEEKKPAKKVEDMRAELKGDKETLDKFNEAYDKKDGFFEACKIYSEWKKNNKK